MSMRSSTPVVAVAAIVLTVGVPFYIAKTLQLGNYAKSPQEVTISLGGSATIAGGRAKLWFAGGDTGGDFEVSCAGEQRYFGSDRGDENLACGVNVRLLGVEEAGPSPVSRAKFRVTWK